MILVRESKGLSKLLKEVVSKIPEKCRGTYYKNIGNLTLESMPKNHTKYNDSYATYEPDLNRIYLNLEKMKENPFYSQTEFNIFIIKHELEHSFSTTYDENDKKVTSGFGGYELDFLTEGYAYLKAFPISNKNFKHRILNHSLVAQLASIIGEDIMDEAFYNNLGLNPLIEELVRQGNDLNKVNTFFSELLNLKENMHYDNPYTSLELVENMLLEFCDNKLKTLSTTSDKLILLERFKASIPTGNYMKDKKSTRDSRRISKYCNEINDIYSIKLDNRLKAIHKVV